MVNDLFSLKVKNNNKEKSNLIYSLPTNDLNFRQQVPAHSNKYFTFEPIQAWLGKAFFLKTQL